MQVTSGMTVPLGDNSQASPDQLLVATHYAYNIARGAAILADKWNAAPESRPIAGTDTESRPQHRRELVLCGLELQWLHGPRRQTEQSSDGPRLRLLAAHAL